MKRIITVLVLLTLFVLPMTALAAPSDMYIGDQLLNADLDTAGYTFRRTNDSYPYAAELTVKNGASLEGLRIGSISLTINVPSGVTASIASVFTSTIDGSYTPMPISITGGGTLNITGGLHAGNGLGISGGTTVNVSNPGSYPIRVDKGSFRVDGSVLTATGDSDSEAAIVLMNLYSVNIANGATVTASGCRYGIRNYQYQGASGSDKPCDIRVTGGSTLDLSANGGAPVYNHYWDDDAKDTGVLVLTDTSTIRMSGAIDNLQDTYTNFPASYRWRTVPGGSWQQHPYSRYTDQSGYTYLELQGNSVYAPKIEPASAEMWIGQSKTFTVVSAGGGAAPDASYQWYVDDNAVSGETGQSFTCSAWGGVHTVRCDVTVGGMGTASVTARLTVHNDISDEAQISNPAYLWRDSFAPAVTWRGETLTSGTDYTVKYTATIAGASFSGTLKAGDMLTMDPGTWTLTYTFKGRFRGSVTADITVGKVPLERAEARFVPASFEYNGESQYPRSYLATYKGYTLRQWMFMGGNYDVEIFLPAAAAWPNETIRPGTYSDKIKAAAQSLYFTGSKTMQYVILPGAPAVDAPTGLTAYYGQKLGDVALPAADNGKWTWKTPESPVGDVGGRVHKAIFTPDDTELYYAVEKDVTVSVVKADTAFNPLEVYNGDTKTTAFTYGDVVTVRARPEPIRPAGFARRSMADPQPGQMALFIGDTQISSAADADESGVYTMTAETSAKTLMIGENTITAKYVGTPNMADRGMDAAVTLSPKPLTVVSVTAQDRCYNSDETWVKITGAVFGGKVLDSDDVRLAENMTGTLPGDAVGVYTEVMLPELLPLSGEHAAYYTAAGGVSVSTSVRITEVPDDLKLRITVKENYTDADIPDTLRKAGLGTVSAIRSRLASLITGQKPEAKGMLLYDLMLEYSEDDGATWYKAEKEHFPRDGKLRVVLPVPAGTDGRTFTYAAAHMFTEEAFGHKPGQTEMPAVSVITGADGQMMLSFEVTGLSPVMIGWDHLRLNLPKTGDGSALMLWLALLGLSGCALLAARRRRNG